MNRHAFEKHSIPLPCVTLLTAAALLGGALERPAAAQQVTIKETPTPIAGQASASAANQAAARQYIGRGDTLRNGVHGGDPAGAEAHFNLANALQKSGESEAAIAEYQQAIHLDMPDPAGAAQHPLQTAEAYRQLGLIRQAKNQLISAAANFRASLRLEPNNPRTHSDLAEAFYGRALYAAAIPEYRAALRLDPTGEHGVGLAATHNNIGVCDAGLKNYVAALTECRAVSRLTPNSYQAHYNLGATLLHLKRYPEAIREFQESLRLNPTLAIARISLGTALYESGQQEAGRIEWRKVLRMGDPDQADVARELLADQPN